MSTYQEQTLQKETGTGCNWEYNPISRQLTIKVDKEVSVYDDDAIQLLKDELPPAETSSYLLVSEDDEMQFPEQIYDIRSGSLYIFLSTFWKKKEEGQAVSMHAIAC